MYLTFDAFYDKYTGTIWKLLLYFNISSANKNF